MAFWKKFYKSKYTGAEIDAAVAKAGDATKVTANPTLAGTEAALTGLEVGETKYKVEQPINVVANPTLAGTEAALEGLQVGDTKYKVGGGGYPEIKVAHFTDPGTGLVCDVPFATIAADMMSGVYYVATFPIPEFGLLYGVGLDSSGDNLEFASGPAALAIGTNYIEYVQAIVKIASDESCTSTMKNIKITATVSNPS